MTSRDSSTTKKKYDEMTNQEKIDHNIDISIRNLKIATVFVVISIVFVLIKIVIVLT